MRKVTVIKIAELYNEMFKYRMRKYELIFSILDTAGNGDRLP